MAPADQNQPDDADPTREAPLGYDLQNADYEYRKIFHYCFQYMIGNAMTGPVLEFGTYKGFTARIIAEYMATRGYDGSLVLYDSFSGLPDLADRRDQENYEARTKGHWVAGSMAVHADVPGAIRHALEQVIDPDRLSIAQGFYEDTLPDRLPGQPAALVHLDCDLYASTMTVLDALLSTGSLQDGALLLFDDYNNNRANPEMGERAALRDAFAKQTRYSWSEFQRYGWHGYAVIAHDTQAVPAAPA